MKKTMIVMTAFLALTTAAKAQDVQQPASSTSVSKKADLTPEERAKKGANHAEKKLGLSATQKSDWEVAALKRAMVNQPLNEKLKGATTPEERKDIHKQIKANNDAFEVSVNAILTPEQKTKFTALKEERRAAKKKEMKKKFDESQVDYGD